MKITLHIDDGTFARARELTGVTDVTTLVEMGLRALIARASAARLAELGGSERSLKRVLRRRSAR